jgi:hypothetical protein
MTHADRFWGGIVAAVVAIVLIAFLCGCLFVVLTVGKPRLTADYIGVMAYVGCVCAFATLPLSVVAAIVVGAPILKLWRRRGYYSVPAYIAAGVLISLIVAVILTVARRVATDFLWIDPEYGLALAIVALAGPVAALTVRAVAVNK